MSRSALRTLHAVTSAIGLLTIMTFFAATVLAEAAGDTGTILQVKTAIAWALGALVPTMAAAGVSGRLLAGASQAPVIRRKVRRLQVVAVLAGAVLIPSALTLSWLAHHGRFDAIFAIVQSLELLAGATNVVLLGLNMRDGFRFRAVRRPGRGSGAVARPAVP